MSTLSRRGLLQALGSAALFSAAPRALAGPKKRSILYISSDEHNARFLSRAGHPFARTPNLDKFFSRGLELRRAYTASPVCAPTRQSWLTGLLPMEHGQLGNAFVFDDDQASLVQRLRQTGYSTACFGKLHTNAAEHDGRFGFDRLLSDKGGAVWNQTLARYRGGPDEAQFDPKDAALFGSMPKAVAHKFLGKVRDDVRSSSDWVLLQEAIAWLRERPAEQPFFCLVSFRFPHYPFDLPRDFYYAYDPAELGEPPVIERDWSTRPGGAYQMKKRGWQSLTPAQTQLLSARYLGAVAYLDWLVGELLAALDAMGLGEDTLVVYATDHGDMGGNKGLWLKDVTYDDVSRKPMALRLPGVLPAGGHSDELMNDADILPTLLGLAGAAEAAPAELTGTDRAAALLGGAPIADATFAYDHISPNSGAGMAMVRTDRYKYTHYSGALFPEGGAELYDMAEDPGEARNLAADAGYARVVAELRDRLVEREQGLRAPRKVEKKDESGAMGD